MVKMIASVIAALMVAQGSATNFFLMTQRSTEGSKQLALENQFFAYDNNTATPCNASTQQSFCQVAPQYNGSAITACSASYNGTQPYADTDGFFVNKNGYYVSDGVVGADRKDGTNFGYNVTHDSNCSPFSCSISSSDVTINFKGFRCRVL